MTRKGDPRLGPLDFLYQEELWQGRQDGELVIMRLDEMTPSHLENVRSWLLDNAAPLHRATLSAMYSMTSLISGEQASWDLDTAIGQAECEDPAKWIREQPLFEAITRRLP